MYSRTRWTAYGCYPNWFNVFLWLWTPTSLRRWNWAVIVLPTFVLQTTTRRIIITDTHKPEAIVRRAFVFHVILYVMTRVIKENVVVFVFVCDWRAQMHVRLWTDCRLTRAPNARQTTSNGAQERIEVSKYRFIKSHTYVLLAPSLF